MGTTTTGLPHGRRKCRPAQPVNCHLPASRTGNRHLDPFGARGATKVNPFWMSAAALEEKDTLRELFVFGRIRDFEGEKVGPRPYASPAEPFEQRQRYLRNHV